LRVMRERKPIERRRPLEPRTRPGSFRVEAPAAPAARDDQRPGRRARPLLPERDHRLLHARDRRLAARARVSRRRSDRRRRTRRAPPPAHAVAPAPPSPSEQHRPRAPRPPLQAETRRARDPPPPRRLPRPRAPGPHENRLGKPKQRELWPNEHETLDDARPSI